MTKSKYEILLEQVVDEFPDFSITYRRHTWLHKLFVALHWFIRILTINFAKMDWSTYTTTIGSTMYVGDTWADKSPMEKYRTLRHELKHVRQFHYWPLGPRLVKTNHVLMGLAYVAILPIFVTFRAYFEWEGYTQTLLVYYEEHGEKWFRDHQEELSRWLAKTFGGFAYFLMGIWPISLWRARRLCRKILAGKVINERDRIYDHQTEPRKARIGL